VSSNVSNLQQVDLGYNNFDEMQEKAAEFNKKCDPSKWEERMRLVTTLVVTSRAVANLLGVTDFAFVHDFGEDDLCARLRRSGYKMILCGDTWICHDHDFRNMEDKDPQAFQNSLESGKRIFSEKYHGIDAWDDILNFEHVLLSPLDRITLKADNPAVLCIDVRCGTPVLEIRNRLRKRGINSVSSYAYTTQAKYLVDLQSVVSEVKCDRSYYIQEYYADNSFDIIVLGEPLNTYSNPVSFLQRLFGFLKPGGALLFKVRNTDDCHAFLRSTGMGGVSDPDLPACLSLNEVIQCVKLIGGEQNVSIVTEPHQLSASDNQAISSLLKQVKPGASEEDVMRLMARNYDFCVTKCKVI
jgi:SAM-dependent methyltransferase